MRVILGRDFMQTIEISVKCLVRLISCRSSILLPKSMSLAAVQRPGHDKNYTQVLYNCKVLTVVHGCVPFLYST